MLAALLGVIFLYAVLAEGPLARAGVWTEQVLYALGFSSLFKVGATEPVLVLSILVVKRLLRWLPEELREPFVDAVLERLDRTAGGDIEDGAPGGCEQHRMNRNKSRAGRHRQAIVIREQPVCKGKAPCFGAFSDIPDGCERGCLSGSHFWKCFAKCKYGRCLVLDVPRRVVQDDFGRTGCREFSIRKCQNLTPSLASAL
jgi:hypothetical protein